MKVVTETKVVPQTPSEVLMQLCDDAVRVPNVRVRDLVANLESALHALQDCATRMACLVSRLQQGAREGSAGSVTRAAAACGAGKDPP